MTGLVVLGSTGSIGQQALEVVRAHPEQFRVVGLAAGRNLDLLGRQVEEFRPLYVSAPALKEGSIWKESRVRSLVALCEMPEVDRVLVATVGATGLLPTLAAIRAGKVVALANKEVLVMAGALVMREARAVNVPILPVDSEHNALWQCLMGDCDLSPGQTRGPIQRVILTASGGAFRDWPLEKLREVTPAEALAHPTWVMGPKVTIDAATLINKGFEVIEAHWLFGLPYEQIDVVLHRESVVHALVEFTDGSFRAELGPPDMRIPIQHALTYPRRLPGPWRRLQLAELGKLNFAPLDRARYPCFDLALAAARTDGTATAALSAADDVAVQKFIRGEIAFTDIPALIDAALQAHRPIADPSVEEILEVDAQVRRFLEGSRAAGTPRA
ncbi:MAG: 1-deoxy-D-xylulose-5-phosphate reductoisomerase [Chloroflexi bacterium]|nr:1-deoxy-D-xylulose-5-phosphate reductoisomerase [Chloroflexota bacterium]